MKLRPNIDDARAVVALWPSANELAEDLGLSVNTVKGWAKRHRNSIPGRYDIAIVEAAARRGIEGLSLRTLAEIRNASLERGAA